MKENSVLLICGDDKLSRELISKIPESWIFQLAIDRSNDLRRIFRLLSKKRIQWAAIFQIAWADLFRKDHQIHRSFDQVRTNSDIESLIKKYTINTVILFRASIIINKELINSHVEFINTHCARIPDYAGLGAINKALKNKDFDQEATLHHVAAKIDAGKVIATQPYQLNDRFSFGENENIAYDAGIDLIIEFMRKKLAEK